MGWYGIEVEPSSTESTERGLTEKKKRREGCQEEEEKGKKEQHRQQRSIRSETLDNPSIHHSVNQRKNFQGFFLFGFLQFSTVDHRLSYWQT